jgi:glyoxylase-like metal-dependent hydrolase (beta-lactamase superfamily II)
MVRAYGGASLYPAPAGYPDGPVVISPGLSFLVHHTPGHSAGCVCLEAAGHKALFTGDTLFRGSVGRTDLPGSDEDAMAESLKTLITKFRGYAVYPGHGPATTIDEEIRDNWFLRGLRPADR